MSEATPDYVIRQIYNNARGIGNGYVVTRADWQKYVTDLEGWFFYNGQMVDMSVESIGGGMYRIKGTFR